MSSNNSTSSSSRPLIAQLNDLNSSEDIASFFRNNGYSLAETVGVLKFIFKDGVLPSKDNVIAQAIVDIVMFENQSKLGTVADHLMKSNVSMDEINTLVTRANNSIAEKAEEINQAYAATNDRTKH